MSRPGLAAAITAIAARDLLALFVSPLAWTLLALNQLVLGIVFVIQLQVFLDPPRAAALGGAWGLTRIVSAPVFSWAAFLLILLVPILAMRALSEERRLGTYPLLLSAPVSASAIVFGKLLGLLAFLGVQIGLVAALPAALLAGGPLDVGLFAAQILGLLLLTGAFAGTGLLLSSLTSQPGAAAGGGFAVLLVLWMLGWRGPGDSGGGAASWIHYLSWQTHLEPFLRGVVARSDVTYFLVLSIGTVGATIVRLRGARLLGPWAGRGWLAKALFTLAAVIALSALVLVGVLGVRHDAARDWTAGGANTLSATSVALLRQLDGSVTVTVASREGGLVRARAGELLDRYRSAKPDLEVRHLDRLARPERARELRLVRDGESAIEHRGRRERAAHLTEEGLTRALYRVSQPAERWIAGIVGHGERQLRGSANHDLGTFGVQLAERGFSVRDLRLADAGGVPDNAALAVVAAPSVALLPAEERLLVEHLERGGNLLWLHEPGAPGLPRLAAELGARWIPGTLMERKRGPLARLSPAIALGARYPDHPVTEQFGLATLFPTAAPIEANAAPAWSVSVLVESAPGSWAETGTLVPPVEGPEGKRKGPLPIAVGLARPSPRSDGAEQRVALVGDADFLSNAYLANQGNLDLALRIVGWLSEGGNEIVIPTPTLPDRALALSPRGLQILAFGALLGAPLVLTAAGVAVWLRRRR